MSIIVELSVENTDKYFKRFSIDFIPNGHRHSYIYIFPKNKEILKYWKYRKQFKCIHDITAIIDKEVLFFTSEDQFINEIDRIYLCDRHYLVFEFPDDMEDDAFYFKMKYCC